MKYRLGDRVKIKVDSPYYGWGVTNPMNVVGVVDVIYSRGDLPIGVLWSERCHNAYKEKDLIFANDRIEPIKRVKEFTL